MRRASTILEIVCLATVRSWRRFGVTRCRVKADTGSEASVESCWDVEGGEESRPYNVLLAVTILELQMILCDVTFVSEEAGGVNGFFFIGFLVGVCVDVVVAIFSGDRDVWAPESRDDSNKSVDFSLRNGGVFLAGRNESIESESE